MNNVRRLRLHPALLLLTSYCAGLCLFFRIVTVIHLLLLQHNALRFLNIPHLPSFVAVTTAFTFLTYINNASLRD